MNIIEEVLKSSMFEHFAKKFEGEERERLEKSIIEMLSPIAESHSMLLSKLADQAGVMEFASALDKIIDEAKK